jgi:hypothetical protein
MARLITNSAQSRFWMSIVCHFIAFAVTSPASAQMTGDRKLLTLVATQNLANRDAILSLEGVADISDKLTGNVNGQPWAMSWERQVDFVYDRKVNQYRSLTRQTREIGTKGGKPVENTAVEMYGTIRTSDAFYNMGPWEADRRVGTTAVPVLTIRPLSEESRGDFSNDFDPFWFFEQQGMDIHNRLTFLHQRASEPSLSKFAVSRAGNLVILDYHGPEMTSRQVFDLDQGGNQIEVEAKDSLVHVKRTFTFEKISNIWVPKLAMAWNANQQKGNINERRVTWIKNVVNSSIPEEAFAWESLGIKSGDLVRDTRTGAEYKYDEPPKPLMTRKAWTMMIVAIVASCTVGFLLFAWRRHMARRAAP